MAGFGPTAESSAAAAACSPAGTSQAGLRLRSLVGLTVGFVAPRANLAVSGVLLTLLVTHRSANALAITLALTGHRLVGWVLYPVLGRASDRTRLAVGRRVPFLAVGLAVMGAGTWAYTVLGGYWPLVGAILVVRTASTVFGLNNVAAVPETFGKSRTLKAVLVVAVAGTAVSVLVKFTAITTWKTNVPASYDLPFRVAAVIMLAAAVVVVVLVREAPAAVELAERDRRAARRPWRDEVRGLLQVPNGPVLWAAVLLLYAGLSATGYLAVVYFQQVQHAGVEVQTLAGWITGVPALMVGIPVGVVVSRTFTRRQVAVVAPMAASGLLVLQFFTTAFWQSVVLAVVAAPLFTAFCISLAPMLAQLLPRRGGLGELTGLLLAPFTAVSLVVGFASAAVVQAVHDYRVIWLFPAGAYLAVGLLMLRLWIPAGQERPPSRGMLLQRIVDGVLAQVTDRNRPLLHGVVTVADADATSWFATARQILGDPYLAASGRRDPPTVAPPAVAPPEQPADTGHRHQATDVAALPTSTGRQRGTAGDPPAEAGGSAAPR